MNHYDHNNSCHHYPAYRFMGKNGKAWLKKDKRHFQHFLRDQGLKGKEKSDGCH